MTDLLDAIIAVLPGLAPDAGLIVLGGFVGAKLGPQAWAGLDRLNFLVLFPALIFVSAAGRPIPVGEVAVVGAVVWAVMGLGFALASLLRPWGPPRAVDFAAAWQTGYRFNTALAFVAVGAMPVAVASQMSIAVGLAVPLANLLAVGALARATARGWGGALRGAALNPFLLASLAGLAVCLSGWSPPGPPMAALDRLAAAAVPLALVTIGATMDWRSVLRLGRLSGGLAAIKLIALPLAALLAVPQVTDDPALVALAVVFAALPTASAAPALARAYGADAGAVSTLVAQSTLLGLVTLPIWIAMVV